MVVGGAGAGEYAILLLILACGRSCVRSTEAVGMDFRRWSAGMTARIAMIAESRTPSSAKKSLARLKWVESGGRNRSKWIRAERPADRLWLSSFRICDRGLLLSYAY